MADNLKKITDALNLMNVAMTQIRLYPPTSPMIVNSMNRAYQAIVSVLAKEESVVIVELGKTYLVAGQALTEKDQRKNPHAIALLDTAFGLGLKSIEFVRGIRKNELEKFLEIAGKNPETESPEKLLREASSDNSFPHILTDHKVYVAVDKDRQILASIGVRDEDIARHFSGDKTMSESELQKARDMAKNPEWVEKAFQTGMNQLLDRRNTLTINKLAEMIVHIIRVLDDLLEDAGKEKLSAYISTVMTDMDNELLSMILAQDIDELLNGSLFGNLMGKLEDEKFSDVASLIGQSENAEKSTTYQAMLASDKGRRLTPHIEHKISRHKEDRQRRIVRIQGGIAAIVRGETAPFADKEVMDAVPSAISDMLSEGNIEGIRQLTARLSDGLLSDTPEFRAEAANTLANICEDLMASRKIEDLLLISPKLCEWIKLEPSFTQTSGRIYTVLGELLCILTEESRWNESGDIADTLYSIAYLLPDKSKAHRNLSAHTLKSAATEKNLTLLIDEFKNNSKGKQQEAGFLLSRTGEFSAEYLLDILEKSQNRAERSQILRLMPELGAAAIQTLTKRLARGGPWFYLRNLILILGKIGTENEVSILPPLLSHEDFRVRQEALNSIYAIGGKYRGEILLSAFSSADETTKGVIADMLGALRYDNAVPVFLEILGAKSIFSTKISDRFKIRLCHALGKIGDTKAVPVLKEIGEQKSLLGISAYSDAVRNAAANAVSEIRHAETKAASHPDVKPKLPQPQASEEQETVFRLAPPKKEDIPLKLAPPQERNGKIVIIENESVNRNSDTIETSAVAFIFDQIVMFAKQKDFAKAEELRQKLIELDPMALSEIVRADEIIEQEKREELHTGTSLWADLDENLSLEEAGALYEAMEEIRFDPDQPVFVQGERNTRLYFIKEGRLKLVYRQGSAETLVRTLEPGDIAGGDSFFFITFCTTSLITISGVSMNYLDKDVPISWKEKYPQLETKLYAYCQPHIEAINTLLKENDMDRRQQYRIAISGQISLQMLRSDGKPESKEFKGNLKDISEGGLSFSIRTSEKTAQVLLGRKLGISADIAGIAVRTKGMVTGVIHRHSSTYSIHVRFDKDLDRQLFDHLEKERKS